jgi:hypothetical protein
MTHAVTMGMTKHDPTLERAIHLLNEEESVQDKFLTLIERYLKEELGMIEMATEVDSEVLALMEQARESLRGDQDGDRANNWRDHT